MTRTIRVNGRERTVHATFSSGPGCVIHTYQFGFSGYAYEYVENIAGTWMLHEAGQWPRAVTVEIPKGSRPADSTQRS